MQKFISPPRKSIGRKRLVFAAIKVLRRHISHAAFSAFKFDSVRNTFPYRFHHVFARFERDAFIRLIDNAVAFPALERTAGAAERTVFQPYRLALGRGLRRGIPIAFAAVSVVCNADMPDFFIARVKGKSAVQNGSFAYFLAARLGRKPTRESEAVQKRHGKRSDRFAFERIINFCIERSFSGVQRQGYLAFFPDGNRLRGQKITVGKAFARLVRQKSFFVRARRPAEEFVARLARRNGQNIGRAVLDLLRLGRFAVFHGHGHGNALPFCVNGHSHVFGNRLIENGIDRKGLLPAAVVPKPPVENKVLFLRIGRNFKRRYIVRRNGRTFRTAV